MNDTSAMRRAYGRGSLSSADAGSDPMGLFARWLEDAIASPEVDEPNAMALATVSAAGVPSVRMVLLKGAEEASASLRFFTGRASRKGTDIMGTHRAAACFWWAPLERQVRFVGSVEELDREEVRAYFDSRPRIARIGAAASSQSMPIGSRASLDQLIGALDAQHPGDAPGDVPLPETWTGFRIVADEIEFWQGRAGRLHDRIAFRRATQHGTPVLSLDGDRDAAWNDLAVRVTDPHGARWLRARLQP